MIKLILHKNRNILLLYSIIHMFIDASSIMLVYGRLKGDPQWFELILMYNILAFGLQLPLGYIFDKFIKPRLAIMLGLILLTTGLIVSSNPWLAVIFVGTGNALFHIGGGIVALNLEPRKAALPGVFVSTGSLGLFLGAFFVQNFGFYPWIAVGILLSLGVLVWFQKIPDIPKPVMDDKGKTVHIHQLIIILFLVAIVLRSLVGLSLNFSWKIDQTMGLYLALSIFLGKGLGGFLADKLGWFITTVFALIGAAFLLYFGIDNWLLSLFGIFLFNMAMPVTLVGVSNCLNNRFGFAFGLTTMALLLGSLPTFFQTKAFFAEPDVIFFLCAFSVLCLGFGLHWYIRIEKKRY